MGVYDDKNTSGRICPHRHKPLLASSLRILSCEGVGIEKNHLSIRETNSMLPAIRTRFPRIPHNPHTAIVYIHYTYIKCPQSNTSRTVSSFKGSTVSRGRRDKRKVVDGRFCQTQLFPLLIPTHNLQETDCVLDQRGGRPC